MKQMFLAIIGAAVLLFMSQNVAFAQSQPKEKSAAEYAASETDRLTNLLDLEGWQAFYVDSTLQHDYEGLMKELQALQSSKVDNMDIYQTVRDKWADAIDAAYKRYFTADQWAKYLKSGAGKLQKAREKRAQKRNN